MLASVVALGCVPVLMACCSAGSPNESHPIGCSTSCPVIRQYRAITSVAVYPSGCPTCSPVPDGYGNMSSTYFFGRPGRRSARNAWVSSQCRCHLPSTAAGSYGAAVDIDTATPLRRSGGRPGSRSSE